jgi:ADP-ribosylglycohydrolase
MKKQRIINSIYGHLVGDALGVPWEFKPRNYCVHNADKICIDTDHRGEHGVKAGTYSDDGSLMIALVASLKEGVYNLQDIADKSASWYYNSIHPFSSSDSVFDAGGTTIFALGRVNKGQNPLTTGACDYGCNGNGSLMRILPLAFYLAQKYSSSARDNDERWRLVKEVSSFTHANLLSVLCCWFYIDVALNLIELECTKEEAVGFALYALHNDFEHVDELKGKVYGIMEWKEFEKRIAYLAGIVGVESTREPWTTHCTEPLIFDNLPHNSGFVINTLINAIYCFLKYDSYEEIVKHAVMLGSDTDTVACIAGGLAGLVYEVPQDMIDKTIVPDYVKKIIDDFATTYGE